MENEDYPDFDLIAYGNWSQDYLNDLDTSRYPFPNTLWHVKPVKEIAIKTTLMVIVGVTGIYLNFVILLVLFKNKWLCSSSNYLIGNLALVDFLTLLFCPWFMLVRDFYQNFVLKQFGCRFEGFLQASLLLANVGALILVSYDRLAIAALTPEARVTKRGARKLIIIKWVVSLTLSLPWIINTKFMQRQWLDYLEMFCVDNPIVLGIYWHFIHTLIVWVPLSIMIVTYGAIMWKLEWTSRKLKLRGSGQIIARAKGKTMRVTACVLLADVVCRIPYSAMIYWRNNNMNTLEINSVDGLYAVLWFSVQYLMYLSCAINPLIYGFTNAKFLKAMDRTPCVSCCKYGSWCCACTSFAKKDLQPEDKNTKVFVIEGTPLPNKKLTRIIKNILHINKDTLDLSVPKVEEVTKPTKITPLKEEYM